MKTSYINPEEFKKQLTENNLSLEAVAKILELEISIAKKIFSGYKSISNFRILKLHELVGFNYSSLITKNQIKTITQVKPKETPLFNIRKPMPSSECKKTVCEKCNFLIITPVNYCPYCGILLPESIRVTNIELIKNEPSDE